MLIRQYSGESKSRSDSPPDDGAPAPFPTVKIALLDNTHMDVQVEWPPGHNVEPFANLLLFLSTGKLLGNLSAAVAIHAAKIGEIEKGAAINAYVQKQMATSSVSKSADAVDDRPVVCPTDMIRLHIKSYQG